MLRCRHLLWTFICKPLLTLRNVEVVLRASPQKCGEGNCEDVEISDLRNQDLKNTRKHQLKSMSKFAFRYSKTHILQKQPPKMTTFLGQF